MFAKDIRDVGVYTKNPALGSVCKVIYYLLPNFHNFNVIGLAAHGETLPTSLIWQNSLYAALYVAILLIASSAIFSGRNLK